MALELAHDDLMMRVDGDIFEVWTPSYDSKRIPLSWLIVRTHYFRKQNNFLLYVGKSQHGRATDEQPLYALQQIQS